MPQKKYEDREAYLKAKSRLMQEYNKENTTRMTFRLNNKTDSDIIEKLESVPSRLGYIKELIRKDIAEKN